MNVTVALKNGAITVYENVESWMACSDIPFLRIVKLGDPRLAVFLHYDEILDFEAELLPVPAAPPKGSDK